MKDVQSIIKIFNKKIPNRTVVKIGSIQNGKYFLITALKDITKPEMDPFWLMDENGNEIIPFNPTSNIKLFGEARKNTLWEHE